MKHSHSKEANSHSVDEDVSNFKWDPKIYDCGHKGPVMNRIYSLLDPIQNFLKLVHNFTFSVYDLF
jgi:hypothetical protein